MKNIWKTLALAVAVTCSSAAFAQEKQDTVKFNPDKKIKKTAKKVGNKTAEVAVKGASTIVDKTYKDKVGRVDKKYILTINQDTITSVARALRYSLLKLNFKQNQQRLTRHHTIKGLCGIGLFQIPSH